MIDPIAPLVARVVEILQAIGAEGEAKRFASIRIKANENYACVFRTLTNVESALKVRWASEGLRGSRLGLALEILGLLRLALQTTLNQRGDYETWLGHLRLRIAEIGSRESPEKIGSHDPRHG